MADPVVAQHKHQQLQQQKLDDFKGNLVMKKISLRSKAISVFGLVILTMFFGCGGNTDGETVPNNPANPTSVGDTRLSIDGGSTIKTGNFKGFSVTVTNSDGKASSDVKVTCDTEKGLSLIEPTSGIESTDSNGKVFGKIGCDNPGNFKIICRGASTGSSDSATVECSGSRPSGFGGFPGAGGGGLGGGSVDNGTTSKVRISAVNVSDTSSISTYTTSIDIVQDRCVSGDTVTAEPFTDSTVTFAIVNNTTNIIKITGVSYKVSNAYGTGVIAASGKLSVTGSAASAVDANGGTGSVASLLFNAKNGSKQIYGDSKNLTEGFKNVNFTLYGENELGDEFTITASTALSFDNFGRCS